MLLCAACATVSVPTTSTQPPSLAPAQAAWARVLERHVTPEGRVDFDAVQRDPAELERFIAYVGEVDPEREPAFTTPQARLAHHLNAYNALAMYAVLRTGIPHTNAGLRKIPFFFFRRYRVGGRSESLYRYEARIRQLGDPRVHFALNCMSVSCPTLPQQPFAGATLDADLEREAREFFASPKHLQIDDAARTLRVSSILRFYTGDFTDRGSPGLIEYINRYREPDLPLDYTVEFLPYDWTINRAQLGEALPGG